MEKKTAYDAAKALRPVDEQQQQATEAALLAALHTNFQLAVAQLEGPKNKLSEEAMKEARQAAFQDLVDKVQGSDVEESLQKLEQANLAVYDQAHCGSRGCAGTELTKTC